MKANECKVQDFLARNKTQFIIPVYQRNYDWKTPHCAQLLKDIINAGKNETMRSYFIGSIVYIEDSIYAAGASDVTKRVIIDGQQRLTTLTLLYIALMRKAPEMNDKNWQNEIYETYLCNKFAEEKGKIKLRPTENHDKALAAVLNGEEAHCDFSNIINNFNFFAKQINEKNYKYIKSGLSKLMIVDISLERGNDDPQKIFESLNSTGLDLSKADLIRNYILMGLNPDEQNSIYKEYWEIIEKQAKDGIENANKVSEFIRDFLTLETKEIANKGDVYNEFKKKCQITTTDELRANLEKIKRYSFHYHKLINPTDEPERIIQSELLYINKLDCSVVYPFLLQIYEDYHARIISSDNFKDILLLLQSFLWRRYVVGLSSNALNKIFAALYDKIERSDYLPSLEKALLQRSGDFRFPTDSEVRNALFEKDVYSSKKDRSYFLEKLNNFANGEEVMLDDSPDITIEHIFPQKPDKGWESIGTDDSSFLRDKLHTIGNLTLSSNTGKMGNKPFKDKRETYKASRLYLNKYLAHLDKWNKNEWEKRTRNIVIRCFQIWPRPQHPGFDEPPPHDELINIFDAEDPTDRRLEEAAFMGVSIAASSMSDLYVDVIKKLFDLQKETFFSTELAKLIRLEKKTDISVDGHKVITPKAIDRDYVIEGTLNNRQKFDRLKRILTVFQIEDALKVKYKPE